MSKTALSAIILATALGTLQGCGGGSPGGTGNPPPSDVQISAITGPDHLQIGVSSPSTYVYSATVTGSSDTAVVWSADDPSLATMNAGTGVVTPSTTKTGTVTITAAAHADLTKTATLKVNVVDWILAGLDLLLMNSDGTEPVKLILATEGYENCSWAYDHLSFVCTNLILAGQQTQFFIFQTDGTPAGTKQTQSLDPGTLGSLTLVENPHFSPDGTKIVFVGMETDASLPVLGTYVVNTDGKTAPVRLAGDPDTIDESLANPRFSPDGTSILYVQNDAVWIMSADGTNQRQLIAALAQNAVFSPDMSKLYYNSSGGVYSADAEGNNPMNIAGAGYTIADVSPNGQSVLFVTLPLSFQPGLFGVYTANSDGTNPHGIDGAGWATW